MSEVKLRDAEPNTEYWGYDVQTDQYGWIQHDIGLWYKTISPVCELDETDRWWWVETDLGERFAFQSIDVEEVSHEVS